MKAALFILLFMAILIIWDWLAKKLKPPQA